MKTKFAISACQYNFKTNNFIPYILNGKVYKSFELAWNEVVKFSCKFNENEGWIITLNENNGRCDIKRVEDGKNPNSKPIQGVLLLIKTVE